MPLVLANRVQETGTANTTVSFTLTGAVTGFQSFAVIGNTNTTYYSATDGSGNWEVGLGTYSTTGPTLTRTTVYASSNSGSAVTFSGAVNVFVTYPSGRSVNLNESGNVSALGTVSSGTWQGSTVGVAYGGTGVTTSSGPNSVVLRDANENITVNRISQGLQTITASGGTTVLTAASDFNQQLIGTGGHTFQLPDATTLTDTTTFQFNNNATGTLTIQNNAATTVGTVAPGGAAGIALMNNSTSGGTWDVHGYIPENVTWGTNSLALGSTVITGGTWNGGTITSAYGGTGLTTFTGANNALYSTSASALAAGTLPVAAGGTGATTLTGYVYGNGTGAMTASTSIPNSATTATNANTASAIVARDASGNFSAGTITATLSGSATSAGSVSNSVTFNNGGAGGASGSTFNGSGALTVSYNTVGAPSTTGTNASGTWSINVTGNAATATNATQLGGYGSTTYIGKFGNTYYQTDTWIQCNAIGGLYWPATNAAEFNANSTSTYGAVAIIGVRNGWRGIHFQGGGNTPHLMFDGSANGGIYYETGGRWASYYNYSNNCWGIGTSNTNATYNVYADKGYYAGTRIDSPIFYDATNTGYYVDPASTSNVNQINMQGYLRRNTSAAGYMEGNYPTSVDGNSSACIYTIGGSYQPTSTTLGNMYGVGYTIGNGTANPGLGMSGWGFYVAGGGVSRVFLDGDSGTVISSGSVRSQIFYDSNNTAYYTDPASTSNLVGLTVANTISGSINGSSASCSGNAATATALSTASGSAPSYAARAWVSFNGTGTVAIRGSANVSSISDNGTGDYTVNFAVAMANANYATVFGGYNATNAYNVIQVNSATAPTASIVRIASLTQQSGVPTATDVAYVNVIVMR